MEYLELEENKVGERMGLYRKVSGLIFDDTFNSESINSRYTLSPSELFSLDREKGQVIIPHANSDATLLFNMPDEVSLLMEVTADYIPTEEEDEGGILIWKDSTHKLEFLESKDTTTEEYSRWRALKKGNRWTFYANRGHGWELFDSAIMTADKMGVVLKHPASEGFVPIGLDRLVLCTDTKITVGNLPPGYTVFLCNPDGNSIASATVQPNWTGIELELPTMPYNGIIRAYDTEGNLLSSLGPFDMYGGDSFFYGTELQVLWKGKELNTQSDTYLGTMYDNQILVQMEILNPSEEKPAMDISLGILQYKEVFGYEWVQLCHDDGNGHPILEFSTNINLGRLEPLGNTKFWMKIEREFDYFDIKPMNFILDINHV